MHGHEYLTFVRESRHIKCLLLYKICVKWYVGIRQDRVSLGVLSASMYHPHL